MKTTVSLTQAQAELPKLARSGQTFTLLRHGEPISVLIPVARLEAILETLEVLGNPAAMKAIGDYRSGKGKAKAITLAEMDRQLRAKG